MKVAILMTALTFAVIGSAYSQMNQKHKRDLPTDFQYGFKPLDYGQLSKPGGFLGLKMFEQFLPTRNDWNGGVKGKVFVHDSMPCYKPEGLFSMRILKPDVKMRYTLLVIDPESLQLPVK